MTEPTLLQRCASDVDEDMTLGLPLIRSLLVSFETRAVIYCYWKCAARVSQALSGEKDLDLLIARGDQHRAGLVLASCGFKLFPSVFHRDHPAVVSHVGFDEESGLLVHVHLHLRLIVGEPLLKNFRLPWESELLARAVLHPRLPVRILDPAGEALMMLARACLELSRLDPVTAQRWAALRDQFNDDLADLAAAVQPGEFHGLVRDLLDEPLADAMARALYAPEPLRHRRQLRRLLIGRIGSHRLYNSVEARFRSVARILLTAFGRLNRQTFHAPRPWSRRSPGGGCVIAVVGLDGSGKSTVVGTLRRWLMTEVDVMPIYFGTGEGRPSLVLLPFKVLVPLIEPLFKTKPKGSSHGTVTKRPPGLLYSTFMIVWASMVALEKRLKLVAARRAANRGMVVVADRYPQNEILRFNDGPLLPRLPWAPRLLRRFEAKSYARAREVPPDLVLKLVITPETAGRREPTMDRGVIAERVTQLRSLVFPGARVVCVDAEQPLAAVIRTIKREVWNTL